MYTKLELPVAMANRGKSYDLDHALTDTYGGRWTTLGMPFGGEAAGVRVKVEHFVNAGFQGFLAGLSTEAGKYLGLAPQRYLDVDKLMHPVPPPSWLPVSDGCGDRPWLLVKETEGGEKLYHSSTGGRRVRYASYVNALRAAGRLNRAEAKARKQ